MNIFATAIFYQNSQQLQVFATKHGWIAWEQFTLALYLGKKVSVNMRETSGDFKSFDVSWDKHSGFQFGEH